MKPKEINRIIGERCGWTKCDPEKFQSNELWHQRGRGFALENDLPDYYNDLNEMADAEKYLGPAKETHSSYWHTLHNITFKSIHGEREEHDWLDWKAIGSATASQKAEAYLKAIHKWKEPKT